jgi:hypothetical protein
MFGGTNSQHLQEEVSNVEACSSPKMFVSCTRIYGVMNLAERGRKPQSF